MVYGSRFLDEPSGRAERMVHGYDEVFLKRRNGCLVVTGEKQKCSEKGSSLGGRLGDGSEMARR